MKTWTKVALALAAWEGAWWLRRDHRRVKLYGEARALATRLGLPLVVVGAPDRGSTASPGAGDLVIDIGPSSVPNFLQADITKRLPLPDNSVVVYVSCVLEYVSDYAAAVQELKRISGGRLFVVGVEPWTLAAYLYPGRKRLVDEVRPLLGLVGLARTVWKSR